MWCTFWKDIIVNYKVGAIIIHEGKVLMVKNAKHPYFYTVGGRVGFKETSENAVLREVYEETSFHLDIDWLAFIHENFYIADFLGDASCHEITFYYLMKQSDKMENINCNSVGIDGGKESLHWLPIEELSNYTLYPEFYKTELLKLGNHVGHFVTEKEHTFRGL